MNKYIIKQYWLADGSTNDNFKFRKIIAKSRNKIAFKEVLYCNGHFYADYIETLTSTFSKWTGRQNAKPIHSFMADDLVDYAKINHTEFFDNTGSY